MTILGAGAARRLLWFRVEKARGADGHDNKMSVFRQATGAHPRRFVVW